MRGRRGHASSSVSHEQLRMALRNGGDVPHGTQQNDENTQEDDDHDELSLSLLTPSSSRGRRRRERENRSKPTEMTEEEMMDLALRLSEQEASRTALRLQKEEEAVMKAIRESMVGETQPCPSSQSVRAGAEASLRSRRKLLYSNRKPVSTVDQESESDCMQVELQRAGKRGGAEVKNQQKKRRRTGSPLLEMPDLSQTQRIQTQASSCCSEILDLPLDSDQGSDSTQIDDCPLSKSPVFPATGCRAEVHMSRLSQDLLQTCRTSGFVLCSQDGWTSSTRSPLTRPRSPTFPSSLRRTADLDTASPETTEQGDERAPQTSPECSKRDTQQKTSPSASRPLVSDCDPGFTFASQDSFTCSVRTDLTNSPVFPRSPGQLEDPPPHRSPDISQTDGGQYEQSPEISRIHNDKQEHPARTSPAEAPRLRQTQDSESDPDPDLRPQSDEELKQVMEVMEEQDSAERELTSDMTLHWSDEDDDVTPVISPSPVFPEERPLNHVTAAAPTTDCSSPTGRQQQPISSQGASATPGGAAAGSTVNYYWGVPFCPRGLDPDRYTQVVLAQMEVYEKSLKRAQSRLLRKAEWGEAILPQPEESPSPDSPADSPEQLFTHRRVHRLRGRKLSDEAEAPPAEDDEEENHDEEEERPEEKKNQGEEETQVDDCEVCPETQLSNDDNRTQDLMDVDVDVDVDGDAAAELRPDGTEPEVQIVAQDGSPAGDEAPEVEETRQKEGNTDGSEARGEDVTEEEQVEEDRRGPDGEKVKDGGPQRSTSPDLDPTVVPQSPETSVDCPLCQGSFPVTQIELHAAYCDGEVVAVVSEREKPVGDCYHVSLKSRRRRRRGAGTAAVADDIDGASNAARNRNQEKCFICQKEVPLREYSRHTELCIQRQGAKTSAKGNLLSALEETESRDSEAGPSGSRPPPGDVIDLRDDDEDHDEGGCVSAVRISNSPIRSFTPISEAAGCLIDFKKQQRLKKPVHRRR